MILSNGLSSCSEKEKGCSIDCFVSASEEMSISWNNYNSVDRVVDYFNCHERTITEHLHDTFKVEGYIVNPGQRQVDFLTYMSGNMSESKSTNLYMSEYGDENGCHRGSQILYIECPPSLTTSLLEYRWGQLLKCTVSLIGSAGVNSGCDCCQGVRVKLIRMETIEKTRL